MIKADGSRLEDENGISVDNAVNAEKLGGNGVEYFASKEYVDSKKNFSTIWTNSNPKTSFAAQTLTLTEIKDANMVLVRFIAGDWEINQVCYIVMKKGDVGNQYAVQHPRYDNAVYISERIITVDWDTGSIAFAEGKQNSSVKNTRCIPVDIIILD